MREIKFRYWNGEEMEYITDLYWFEESMVHEMDKNFTQFTGLKDKNNNDIYEGDIIACDEIDSSSPSVGKKRVSQHFKSSVVTWDKQLLCYFYNPIRPGLNYKNYAHQMLGYAGNIEIIGNIYQNPNLIETTT